MGFRRKQTQKKRLKSRLAGAHPIRTKWHMVEESEDQYNRKREKHVEYDDDDDEFESLEDYETDMSSDKRDRVADDF